MSNIEKQAGELREFLNKLYNGSGKKEDLDALTDEEIIELASNLRKGASFASPVFDGAKESEIREMLNLAYPSDDPEVEKLGFNDSKTQITLYDGRSGCLLTIRRAKPRCNGRKCAAAVQAVRHGSLPATGQDACRKKECRLRWHARRLRPSTTSVWFA